VKIGLEEEDLQLLATAPQVEKASRRDLAFFISQKKHAATTVAATMILASWAGIELFATGGIGGVHRGASQSFDISADLQELARSPVTVVSAGAKAILDLGLTLEYLETQGVPVIGVGTDEFPAFYSRESGFPVPARLDQPEAIAGLIKTHRDLKLESGLLVANPIPEAWSLAGEDMERVIGQALEAAGEEGIAGKALTPFLLDRIKSLTQGKSLVSNIALVRNNARLAAQIAVALHSLSHPSSS
jgi:pseudouridine-5'-phosphate glycosidase